MFYLDFGRVSSFGCRYLRRYFWEWDDFRSYVVFLGAASLAIGVVCAVGQFVPGFAQLMSLLAVASWSAAPAAQVGFETSCLVVSSHY